MPPEGFTYIDLTQGQNDTHGEEGLEFPKLRKVTNTRYDQGYPSRRPGFVRLTVAGTDAESLDFTAASSHYYSIPAHSIHALTPPFSKEILFNPDSVTGTQVLQGFLHAADIPFTWYLDGDDLVVMLTKSGAGTITLTAADVATIGTTCYGRLVVNADGDCDLYVDDATTADDSSAGAMDGETLIAAGGAMAIGRNNAGNYFDGQIDYVRCCRGAVADNSLAFMRHPSPRASYMVYDYSGPHDSSDNLHDRSPQENHSTAGTAAGTATTLCVNPAPVQALKTYRDKENQTKLLVVAGGRIHRASI